MQIIAFNGMHPYFPDQIDLVEEQGLIYGALYGDKIKATSFNQIHLLKNNILYKIKVDAGSWEKGIFYFTSSKFLKEKEFDSALAFKEEVGEKGGPK